MGVGTVILSATAPGPDIEKEPAAAQALARAINEFNAQIRDAQPQSYGFFASVPSLLNTDASIEEMRYALDDLKADGVVLMTRYGDDNHYLGHADFTKIWDFLNTRKAVVFIHPTHAVDTNLVNKRLPQPAIDYPHETGRTAVDLISSNMLRDHASACKIILSHAGGTLPYLIDRYAGVMQHAPASFRADKSRDDILREATMFYYDTALSSSHMVLTLLTELLGPEAKYHILFGSDFPNAPTPGIEYFTAQLEANTAIDLAQMREGGLKLFPRLRT
jgi:6-methylsalicylate decarboxylase